MKRANSGDMQGGKLAAGEVVGGLYVVEGFLGAGAMGEVYRAHLVPSPKAAASSKPLALAALKVLHKHLAQDADVIERFRREARVAARISSPYVAAVRHAKIESEGRHWIAFELLEGESLDTRLRREQTMPFADVARLVEHVLEGLVAAHAHQVVHRDLKPSNLFLEGAGEGPWTRARILDFGVSKVRGHLAPTTPLTGLDATLGSISFMPPEQIRNSASVDARADFYALGFIISKCLTGAIPLRARTLGELAELKQHIEPQTLFEQTGTAWPPALDEFQRQLLALDREERFPSAFVARDAWRATCRAVLHDGGFDSSARWRPVDAGEADDPVPTELMATEAPTSSA